MLQERLMQLLIGKETVNLKEIKLIKSSRTDDYTVACMTMDSYYHM